MFELSNDFQLCFSPAGLFKSVMVRSGTGYLATWEIGDLRRPHVTLLKRVLMRISSRVVPDISRSAPVHLPVHLKAVRGGSFPFRWREGFQDGEIEDILSVASA